MNKVAKILNVTDLDEIVVSSNIDKDLFTGLSILLGAIDIAGNVQEPTIKISNEVAEAVIDNPSVITIGFEDNVALRNFSQAEHSITGGVLKYLSLYNTAQNHTGYLDYYETVYTKDRTPATFARNCCEKVKPGCGDSYADFGIKLSKRLAPAIINPIESTIVDKLKDIDSEPWLPGMLKALGLDIIKDLSTANEVGSVLDDCEVYYVGNLKVFDSTGVIDGGKNSTSFVNNYLNENNKDVSVVISNDTRGGGLSFFRRNDSPDIDFSKVIDHNEVIYASEEGQLAKTKTPLQKEEKISLIESSLTR
jgi:hypothetical protein